jgi:hypothetical protein
MKIVDRRITITRHPFATCSPRSGSHPVSNRHANGFLGARHACDDRVMRPLVGVIAIALLVASGQPTSAEPRAAPPEQALPTAAVVGGDALAFGLIAGGYAVLRLDNDRSCDVCSGEFGLLMMAFGAGTYVALGPTAHRQRGHAYRAYVDGALRVAVPVAAGLATARVTDREAPIVGAIGATMLGAMVLDWTILRRESSRVQPAVTAGPHGAVVGFALSW